MKLNLGLIKDEEVARGVEEPLAAGTGGNDNIIIQITQDATSE